MPEGREYVRKTIGDLLGVRGKAGDGMNGTHITVDFLDAPWNTHAIRGAPRGNGTRRRQELGSHPAKPRFCALQATRRGYRSREEAGQKCGPRRRHNVTLLRFPASQGGPRIYFFFAEATTLSRCSLRSRRRRRSPRCLS